MNELKFLEEQGVSPVLIKQVERFLLRISGS